MGYPTPVDVHVDVELDAWGSLAQSFAVDPGVHRAVVPSVSPIYCEQQSSRATNPELVHSMHPMHVLHERQEGSANHPCIVDL